MAKARSTWEERRSSRRYRVPGRARVFWGGDGTPVAIADVSSGGCLVIGEQLPAVGTRVFLSLDIGGLPNVRLPAITVRHHRDGDEPAAAVRFDVPAASTGGLDRLLAQHVAPQADPLAVLIVDSDDRSRTRIADALRATGARVFARTSASTAITEPDELSANVALARADVEGLAALSFMSRERPQAFRVAFGRKSAIDSALALGIAQAAADDPCSAKCLSELLQKGRTRAR